MAGARLSSPPCPLVFTHRVLPCCCCTPLSPCFHSHSHCDFRRGAQGGSQFSGCCHLSNDLPATSHLADGDPPRPRSHPNSALSHACYRILEKSNSKPLPLVLGLRCTAVRTLLRSPIGGAVALPAFLPLPPPLAFSSFFPPGRFCPNPTAVDPYPALLASVHSGPPGSAGFASIDPLLC